MAMMRMGWVVMGLAGGLLMGCQNKLADDNVALHRENRELRAELAARSNQLRAAPDPSELAALQNEIAQRDAKIQELETSLRQPTPGQSNPGIAGIETSYDASAGTVTVNLPGDVLFDSGSVTLKESAKSTLSKVATAIKSDYSGRAVRVEGHTDSDPIRKTQGKWDDNLDLSLNRAAAVTRYLESQGVPPKLITTSGFGPHQPRGANKAQNRRVDIVVVVK